MSIIAKFTRTLPAPTATISGGFVFLLSAGWFTQANTGAAGSPIDGGTNSIANGGGDMQIFSDTGTTTRLPIEVVTFVTGGSPQCQVWVRTPSYTAGDTITIGKDDTQTTQPAVGAAFGRNAAWVDFEAVIHANEEGTNGVFSDSTGNGHDTTLTTGSTITTTSLNHPFGGTWPDFTGSQALTISSSAKVLDSSAMSMSVIVNLDASSISHGLISNRYSTDNTNWFNQNAALKTNVRGATTNDEVDGGTFATGVNTFLVSTHDATSLDQIQDGIIAVTDTTISNTAGIISNIASDYRIGTYFDDSASRRSDGRSCEYRLWRAKTSQNKATSEYTNQNDPDNFGTSSEYILVGGSGISLTATLGTIEYNSNDSVVSLAGSVDVTATLGSINYSSNDASIQVSGGVSVIATLGVIDYTSNDASISLFGNVDIVATLGTISYTSNDAGISLAGGINVAATLGVIDYASNDSVITLQGQIPINTTLGAITYDSYNVTVQVGTGQFIGTVTAGFANDIYSAGFKPSAITVNFKS